MKKGLLDLGALTRRAVAEFLGTLLLSVTFGVCLVGSDLYPQYQAMFIPFAVGIALAALVYLFGGISGGHFNPAVSLGIFLTRRLRGRELIVDWLSQIVGAFAGFSLVRVLMVTGNDIPSATNSASVAGEFIGSFVLVFAFTAVALGKVTQALSGLVVGLSVAVGITLSLAGSGGLLNPAFALALHGLHFSYLISPLLGGLVAASIAIWLYHEEA